MKRARSPTESSALPSALRAFHAERRLAPAPSPGARVALVDALLAAAAGASPDAAAVLGALAALRAPAPQASDLVDVDAEPDLQQLPYSEIRRRVIERLMTTGRTTTAGATNIVANIHAADDERAGVSQHEAIIAPGRDLRACTIDSAHPFPGGDTSVGPERSVGSASPMVAPAFRLNRTPGAPSAYAYTMRDVLVARRASMVIIIKSVSIA
jgi:hypothetical protein